MRRIAAVVAALVLAGCGASTGSADKTPASVPAKVTAPSGDKATTTTTGAPKETTTTAVAGSAKTDPLPIGTEAKVSDYNVKVTSVNQDAAAAVKGYNEFNDDPTNGRYVLISLDATYTGDTEGDPGMDLSLTLSGGDAKQYDAYQCSADLGDKGSTSTIEPGGTLTYLVCFDVPEAALAGGAVFAEDNTSFDHASRTYWALA